MIDGKRHYYVEPVEIEIYLKKAGRVRTVIKDLRIELIDVETTSAESKEIFAFFKERNEPIDLMEVQNNFPRSMKIIYESYYKNMELFEKLSMHFKSGMAGSSDSWRLALYFTELLLKYEPTVASKIIGDFQTYNLNYLIIKLYALGEEFLLEDSTVAYLIKRRNEAHRGEAPDREFDKLVELWEYNVREKFF